MLECLKVIMVVKSFKEKKTYTEVNDGEICDYLGQNIQ